MKEQIYTIPVNEAYGTDCECPLCLLERKLEEEAVDYALGAAMMEPDYRVDSNSTGYCREHYRMMFDIPNKLSLALVLDTHLEEVRKKIDKHKKSITAAQKGGLFKKTNLDGSGLEDTLTNIESGCMICKKINHTMDRYIDVLIYLWNKDAAFKAKFDKSKGVCIPHFKQIVSQCKSSKESNKFLAALFEKETAELERIQNDIHKFTLKFDYRNTDMEWGSAQDAPIRTIEKLSKYKK